MNFTAIAYALASAILFGISTPVAKGLLGDVSPIVLAGLLYCGAGIGALALRSFSISILRSAKRAPETALQRSDLPWLAAAVTTGGVVGPILLLVGLERTGASNASLLLTLESLTTGLIAWFVFHESFDRRIALGMLCLVGGAAVLAWSDAPTPESLIGPAAIVAACLAWGLDNNFTRKVSLADPLQIVAIKGLVAGPVNLLLSLWAGAALPNSVSALSAAIVGFLCYGVSLVFYILALRDLGTARTAAYFSVAPFFGAAVAVIVYSEPVTAQLMIAGALMALGVWLHATERHKHEHVHERQVHSHPHVHDEIHQHSHGANDAGGEPHTHLHVHERLTHSHQHTPDMHHTHRH